MVSPYSSKPAHAFWRRSVSGRQPTDIDPVVGVPFRLTDADAVATAGSCFAQHIAKTLQRRGFRYLVTEAAPQSDGAADENYGVFPARFGNIYTVRQLLQLFQRAFGVFEPVDSEWDDGHGRLIDPFRPRIQQAGFASAELLRADRDAHLEAVRTMFETCDVFVFTLGLTEGWESAVDGAVFPLAPGVVASGLDEGRYRFHNFTVAEMEADMRGFLALLRRINPAVRVILTVSPVALAATFADRHVLVANTYSKSALRVVAESISTGVPDVAYFPSFEIVTGAPSRSAFLADDLREVTDAGVDHVMSIFARHFLSAEPVPASSPDTHSSVAGAPPVPHPGPSPVPAGSPDTRDAFAQEARMRERQAVICDEEVIERVS